MSVCPKQITIPGSHCIDWGSRTRANQNSSDGWLANPSIPIRTTRFPWLNIILLKVYLRLCCDGYTPDGSVTEGPILLARGCSMSFWNLKQLMTKTPVLTSLDFSIPFVLETNTFGFAMGAVLLQNSHLIAFFSKTFYPRLQRASTYV